MLSQTEPRDARLAFGKQLTLIKWWDFPRSWHSESILGKQKACGDDSPVFAWDFSNFFFFNGFFFFGCYQLLHILPLATEEGCSNLIGSSSVHRHHKIVAANWFIFPVYRFCSKTQQQVLRHSVPAPETEWCRGDFWNIFSISNSTPKIFLWLPSFPSAVIHKQSRHSSRKLLKDSYSFAWKTKFSAFLS